MRNSLFAALAALILTIPLSPDAAWARGPSAGGMHAAAGHRAGPGSRGPELGGHRMHGEQMRHRVHRPYRLVDFGFAGGYRPTPFIEPQGYVVERKSRRVAARVIRHHGPAAAPMMIRPQRETYELPRPAAKIIHIGAQGRHATVRHEGARHAGRHAHHRHGEKHSRPGAHH